MRYSGRCYSSRFLFSYKNHWVPPPIFYFISVLNPNIQVESISIIPPSFKFVSNCLSVSNSIISNLKLLPLSWIQRKKILSPNSQYTDRDIDRELYDPFHQLTFINKELQFGIKRNLTKNKIRNKKLNFVEIRFAITNNLQ